MAVVRLRGASASAAAGGGGATAGPGPDDVLLHIRATGICGSGMHLWRHGGSGPLRCTCGPSECVLGQESAGVVLRAGRYNLCNDVAFAGVWPHDGTCQRFEVRPAARAHRMHACPRA